MKAILTRYLGPTNYLGSRVAAVAGPYRANRVVISWDDEKDAVENHRAAALALCRKRDWTGQLVTGSLADAYVHVFSGR